MRSLLIVCFLASVSLIGQEAWQAATDLPGVDFSGLSAEQKTLVLQMLREEGCSCGCGMKMAECRVKDPACGFSKGLAEILIKNIRDGKSPDDALAAVKASPLAKGPAPKPILEAPVLVPVAGDPSKGPESARVVLIEFSDFECPYCRVAVRQVEALMKLYPKDIRLFYKQFPLSMHPHAHMAAAASLAAAQQGKFWEMHDQLFAHSRELSPERILLIAKDIGLDVDRFRADLRTGKLDDAVNKDMMDGEKAGVQGTPAFFINGKLYNGAMDVSAVKPLIEAELRPVTASK